MKPITFAVKTISASAAAIIPYFHIAAIAYCGEVDFTTATNALAAYVERNPPKDVLALADSSRIKTAEEWMAKVRPEVLKFFDENVYGAMPPKPAKLDFNLVEYGYSFDGAARRRQYSIRSEDANGTHEFTVLVYLPRERHAPEKWRGPGKIPVFVYPNFSGNHTLSDDPAVIEYKGWTYPDKPRTRGGRPDRVCVEEIVRRGFGFATFCFNEVYPDYTLRDGEADSVWRIFDPDVLPGERLAHPAWSWGSMRVRDLLEILPEIDQSKVAIVGQSRMGKNATITGVHDDRFSLVIANCGGTKSLKHLPNLMFPYWFSHRLARYVQTDMTSLPADVHDKFSSRFPPLPFDQGEFLGCIAPRALVVSTATGDRVSSPESNYRTYLEACQIFALHGKAPGWHIKEGKHSITHEDWRWFMDYAEEVLKW